MNVLFTSAIAEQASELSEVLEGTTPEEALVGGAILGAIAGTVVTLGIVYFILRAIADWKIFTKAGVAGWKSLIPFLCDYEEYKLCWNGKIGLAAAIILAILNIFSTTGSNPATWLDFVIAILCIIALVLSCMQSMRLAKAFGKGTGFGIGLLLLGPIFRLVLGFGKAQYLGHPDR